MKRYSDTAMAMRCVFVVFVVLLCAMFPRVLPAQIVLTGNSSTGTIIAKRGTPYFSAELAATKGGKPFLLSTNNVVIIENNASSVPVAVSPPDNGFQTVTWKYTNHRISAQNITPHILVYDGNQTADVPVASMTADHKAPYVQFQDSFSERIREINFGAVTTGLSKTISVEVRAITGIKLPNGNELPVSIDSMVIKGNGFSASWKGNFVSTQPPPVDIISPFGYKVDITFSPSDNSYSRGSLFIYYDSGLYAELVLEGNFYLMPDVSAIKLLTPNGGERFGPCEEVPVKWAGHVDGLPTTVEYSVDGGKQWKTAGQSNDSAFTWRVPAEFSDKALLRASQQLTQSDIQQLIGPKFKVYSLAFSPNGKNLLAGYSDGSIIEWDVASATILFTYPSPGPDATGRSHVLGLGYTADGSIAALIHGTSATEPLLAIYKRNTTTPFVFDALPLGFEVQSASLSPDGTQIFIAPVSGAQLYVYSTANGEFVRTVDLPAPIGAVAFSSETKVLGVALLDNTVRLLHMSDFSIFHTIQLSGIPMSLQLALSPDNAYTAIAARISTPTLTSAVESEVNVIETATGQIVRTLRNVGASNSVGISFSSTARYLAIGKVGVPQVGLWNLIADSFNGQFDGHSGVLTDIQFSPVGTNLATSSVAEHDNVRLRGFAFPERDQSDNFFSIMPLNITINSPLLPPTYIGAAFDTVLTGAFCNAGEVQIILTNVRLESGMNFRLVTPFAVDTLQPGECLSFEVAFEPRDTGTIADRLIYSTCNSELALPLEAKGMNRAIAMLADKQSFGDICVGETIEKEIDFLRNDDPIPLTIDHIEINNPASSPFTILTSVSGVVLQPGETLRLRVRFQPTVRGDDNRVFRIYHSGQNKVIAVQTILGRGLGAEITLQSNDLRFIPEAPSRPLVLTNTSNISVVVDSVNIIPAGAFTVTTPLPVVIPAGGQVELDIEWNLAPTSDAALSTFFTPCAIAQTATIGLYKAASVLSMPVVEADPRGSASIPIRFKTIESKPYNGTRIFETEFTVNAGLFLPTSITSEFGEAQITRNDITGNQRIIGIRVEGTFPTEGVVAVVSGPAGLAEVTTSTLAFATALRPWGEAVQTTFQSGDFRLTGVCGDRRLLPVGSLAVQALYPNPAHGAITVEFEAPADGNCSISVVDALGTTILAPFLRTAVEGRNSIQFVLPPVADGNYRLIVQQGTSVTSAALTVRNQ